MKGHMLYTTINDYLINVAPTRALEPHEVRQEIYRRECKKLHVIPISSYLRNPITNALVVPHCGLGPMGALALAAPLMESISRNRNHNHAYMGFFPLYI